MRYYTLTDVHIAGFMAIDWSLMTFALSLVIMRLYLRKKRQVHSLAANLSDLFLVSSWLAGIIDISINTWKNSRRMRYVSWPESQLYYMVPYNQSAHLLKVSWICLYFIYISLWLSKAAFIAFYYDMFFTHGNRGLRWALYTVSVFAGFTFVLQMSLLTFWCHPISGNWNVKGELCSAVHSITSVTISTFANVATDLLIVSIPASAIANCRWRKIEIVGIFFVLLMGSISIIAAIARFIILKVVEHVPRASITHTIDVCATVEIVASLSAVCLPFLRTFIRQRRPVYKSDKGSGYSSKGSPLLKGSSNRDGCSSLALTTASTPSDLEDQTFVFHHVLEKTYV